LQKIDLILANGEESRSPFAIHHSPMQEPTYPSIPIDSTIESLKTPPFSREAEQSVLGGLMLNNEKWISIAEILTKEDFHLYQHQILFNAIRSLSEENNPCDPVTLSEWLQRHDQLDAIGGGGYLGELAGNTPSAANITAYAEIVRERSILRQLVQVGTKITESAFNTQGRKTADLLDDAERLVFEIAEKGKRSQSGFAKIDDVLNQTLARIDKLSQQEGRVTGIPTDFQDFDNLTSGLQPSDLIIVAGRPSMGKTSFAMNLAENAAIKGQMPVAVFSMEMSDEQLAMRLISSAQAR
jgi:replicative DNA helicase